MSHRFLIIALVVTLSAAALFALDPGLDLRLAALFYGADGFSAQSPVLLRGLRRAGYTIPYLLMAGAALAWAARRLGWIGRAPSGRAVLFMAATMALGPGLLVNAALKNHSHRPRPIQIVQFGGTETFRPWFRFDGECPRNCSFASGEAAIAFWTAAPALAAPPQIRAAAVGASLVFGAAVGLLRMAFGGHFASDVLLAAGMTLILTLLLAALMRIGAPGSPPPISNRNDRADATGSGLASKTGRVVE